MASMRRTMKREMKRRGVTPERKRLVDRFLRRGSNNRNNGSRGHGQRTAVWRR